jgi:uncharacterized membrane protein (UPF0127 family)
MPELRYGPTVNRRIFVFVVLAVFGAAGLVRAADALSPLTIHSASGTHRFNVELADTAEKRSVGLMHRPAMAADGGMLFDFKTDGQVTMWMRNTRIPLDMLFITRDGRIANIAERTVPFSETTIPSKGPVRAVLELNGGTSARLKIKPGDRVDHPMFAKPQ